MTSDKEGRRKLMTDLFATPGFSLNWQVSKVEVARSGDIGYSLGAYQLSMNDANGKPMVDRGKYATVWRKQPDGSWKAIVDMFNTDLPAAAPKQGE
jgi:ketosteroid isomerase-like protein